MSYLTQAIAFFSTTFDVYQLEFENAYDAADFLLKHKIVTFEQILEGTEDRLRKPLFEEVSKRHKRRERKRIARSAKVAPSSRHVDL